MKQGKRVASATVCMALLFMAACGGSDEDSSEPAPAPGTVSATLAWTSNTEGDLAGYRVYFGAAPRNYQQTRGSGLNAGATPELTVTGLTSGTQYYFAVTAYDRVGNESAYSTEVARVAQ